MLRSKSTIVLALAIVCLTITASFAQKIVIGGIEYGTGRRVKKGHKTPTHRPTRRGRTHQAFFDRSAARVVMANGHSVTGTAGKDSNGFVQWMKIRKASLSGSSAGNRSKRLIGVNLKPESKWLRVTSAQVRGMYNRSVKRANKYLKHIQIAERRLRTAHYYHKNTNSRGQKKIYARQYHTAKRNLLALAKARQAEFRYQRQVRPGR